MLFILACLCLLLPGALAQTVTVEGQTLDLTDTLPQDPAVRTGELPNGLKYYLRFNDEPRNRAELALAIRAGSILETEEELGLAHFVEHMLFKGTESFQGSEIIDFLERIGMVFGPDVNAYTSFDETVYTLRIPLDDLEIIDTSFQILAEWASKATFDEAEIEPERGVIVEEWRQRSQNVNGRLSNAIIPLLLGDSRYAERLPIGDMDIVRSVPRETFVDFFERWYRPELMAVVAVGDFDIDVFEAQIVEAFAVLENPPNAAERPEYAVPLLDEPLYYSFTDPEFPVTAAQVIYKSPSSTFQTVNDFRDFLLRNLFVRILNERLADRTRAADAPFLNAQAESSDFIGGVRDLTFTIITAETGLETGIAALFEELMRAQQFGFSEAELNRAKTNLLTALRQNFNERDDLDSRFWRSALIDDFLSGSVVTSNEADLELGEQLLPGISAAEVSDLASGFSEGSNRAVLVLAPEKADLQVPDATELEVLVLAALEQEVAASEELELSAELMINLPEPVAITSQAYVPELNTTLITLANGIEIILKPTDFVANEVLFSGVAYGGTSLVSDEDYPEAAIITSVITESGVAEFSRSELQRLLTGKNVSLGLGLNDLTRNFSGRADRDDLETLFQLVYLYSTQPRKDSVAFERVRSQIEASILNRANQPQAVFQDAITAALYGDHLRYTPLTIEQLNSIDFERAFAIFEERFTDLNDFTFVLVGDFDVAEVTALAQRYLGNLPGTRQRDTWRSHIPPLPMDILVEEVYKGIDEQSILHLRWDGPFYNPVREERFRLFILDGVLSINIREKIREELGAAYSPQVFSNYTQRPSKRYTLGVQIFTAPELVENLLEPINEVLYNVRDHGPDADTLQRAKEQVKRNLETSLETNSYWRFVLEFFYFFNPHEDPLTIVNYAELVDAISAAEIQEMAQRFIVPERYIQVILYPETYQP